MLRVSAGMMAESKQGGKLYLDWEGDTQDKVCFGCG